MDRRNIPRFRGELKGFTLIEVLIVIVIISIVTSVATLTIHFNRNKQLESFAHTLANQITLAEQEAMLRPAILGLALNTKSIQFFIFRDKDHSWQPIDNKVFHPRNIPEKTQVTLSIDNQSTPADGKPRLIITSSGEIPAFTISIGVQDEKPLYRVIGETNGNVYVK